MGLFDIFRNPDNGKNSKSAEQRKKLTEQYLKSLDIPFIEHLPLLDEEHEVKIRDAKEITERILVLVYLAYVSEVPDEKENVITFLKANRLWDKVSPNEKKLYQKEDLTDQEAINISWRSEAAWLLLWSIKKVDELELPIQQIEINDMLSRLPEFLADPIEFIQNAVVRPTAEILDASDLIYRLHWAARNADLRNKPMPAKLDLSVIMERHYAINWLTFYADEWDKITTDT